MSDPGRRELDGTVHEATVIRPEELVMHPKSRIDSYCLVNATGGAVMEEETCIHAGSHVVGGGGFEMRPRSVVTYNCVLLTSTADLRLPASTMVPVEERESISGTIVLGRESFVGANTVLMPGVELGEGAVVAAGSFVDDDVPPWTVRYPDGQERPRPVCPDGF